ncbi:hypothetical protein NMY22_g16173 [Coprinellus aureogranulatus]|nr:hypothetical protein NMY22_g16173 [Coprinellus aureogranulatus]
MEKSKELGAGIPPPASTRLDPPKRRPWRRYIALVAAALLLVAVVPLDSGSQHRSHPPEHPPKPPLPADKAEELFLYGSTEDFDDAQVVLEFFQEQLGIPPARKSLIYKAGSRESRHATLGLTSKFGPRHPTAWIDTYFPVLNTPLNRTLQLLGKDDKVIFDADLSEDGDPEDPDAGEYRDAVPPWHGLSFDGEATGEYVYANYGRQEDYAELTSKGVDLKGKIVIARYGYIFRGLKIKGAQELGAAGVIIYTDPRDDGHVTEANGYATYPYGPARNPTSVQRGSVQFLSPLSTGDLTTPVIPRFVRRSRTGQGAWQTRFCRAKRICARKGPPDKSQRDHIYIFSVSISVSTRACHARKLGSTPRQRADLLLRLPRNAH